MTADPPGSVLRRKAQRRPCKGTGERGAVVYAIRGHAKERRNDIGRTGKYRGQRKSTV